MEAAQMITRRNMLAALGGPIVPRPRAPQDQAFDRIDAHVHIHRVIPDLIANLKRDNWRALSICVWEQFDPQPLDASAVFPGFNTVDELHSRMAQVHRESQGRIAWAGTFDAREFEKRSFTERAIACVERSFRHGAVGIKIWKTIGMKIRGRSGDYLLPDDRRLLPIYAAIQKADRTLIVHVADPDGAWLPLNSPGNADATYYRRNPRWHVGDQPGAPSKEALLKARDNILARYPKLRVVGAHLGSHERDLSALAKRLAAFPNFAVDCSARVTNLLEGDRAAARAFLERFQDRVLYGSDCAIGSLPDTRIIPGVLERENREWSSLEADAMVSFPGRQLRGLKLPGTVLRKIFHSNAARWYPGFLA